MSGSWASSADQTHLSEAFQRIFVSWPSATSPHVDQYLVAALARPDLPAGVARVAEHRHDSRAGPDSQAVGVPGAVVGRGAGVPVADQPVDDGSIAEARQEDLEDNGDGWGGHGDDSNNQRIA